MALDYNGNVDVDSRIETAAEWEKSMTERSGIKVRPYGEAHNKMRILLVGDRGEKVIEFDEAGTPRPHYYRYKNLPLHASYEPVEELTCPLSPRAEKYNKVYNTTAIAIYLKERTS